LCAVLAVALFAAGCVSRRGPELPGPRVAGSEPVSVAEDGERTKLSPDGSRLLRLGGEPCVVALDGSDEWCVEVATMRVDWRFAAWSPDGTRLAFTDNSGLHLDPDIWVLDATSGELSNLTDDGVQRVDADPSGRAHRDVFPSWSADGETIRFARAGAQSISLVTVPTEGGEVTTLREIPCTVDGLIALTTSEHQVAWNCYDDGYMVYLGEHTNDRAARLLAGDYEQDRGLLSFSPDGDWLLVDSLYDTYHQLWQGDPQAIPVDGGHVHRVGSGDIGFPTWSPTGHALVYVQAPGTVLVTDEPGGEPRELYTAEQVEGPDGMRLSWQTV
jgi:Tol biopolymer transport system component